MFSVIVVVTVLAAASAFTPSRFATRATTSLFQEKNCEARVQDKKGRCPGETGYTGYKIEPPADFAAFKAAAAAKKAAAEAAKK
eukprot:CAMPEP_0201098858 /NCGR_PEP_ID=MMETSP0812-20130820/7870_1 /ASSEMBLY_ACC=CAM_ASM_000668 /TAXON_ID=98059 /ORGANISM="Dinobryon sp., Strain UTEXLB2267" /LENGTH=83 /DNA_ID=CAMNT_0047354489 /DNA_START=54 /DNA_END=305 /DNA_ORIENTATION=+